MNWIFLKKNIFIPILPESLLNYVTAPMPFLVGIHSSHLEQVRKLPVDDILYVNLDTGSLRISSAMHKQIKEAPGKWLDTLKQQIDNALAIYQHGRSTVDNEGLSEAFKNYFFTMLYDYQNFYQRLQNGKVQFQLDEFLNSQPKETKFMCQQFCESQMFHTYTFNVATELEVKKGSSYQFEKDLYTFVQNHPRGFVYFFLSSILHMNT